MKRIFLVLLFSIFSNLIAIECDEFSLHKEVANFLKDYNKLILKKGNLNEFKNYLTVLLKHLFAKQEELPLLESNNDLFLNSSSVDKKIKDITLEFSPIIVQNSIYFAKLKSDGTDPDIKRKKLAGAIEAVHYCLQELDKFVVEILNGNISQFRKHPTSD